jgi:hypothetical protein
MPPGIASIKRSQKLVTHLNKSNLSNDPLARVIDSTAFGAAVRTAFLIIKDKANPERRLFLPLKSNISRACLGLAFRIEPHVLGSGIETSRVSWENRPVTITAEEALAPLTPDDDIDTAKELAEACLRVIDKEKATELRSSNLIARLKVHESLFLSDKQLKKRLGLLNIQIHRRSDANYYVKADFVPP